MGYAIRVVIQDEDGRYVNTGVRFDGFHWDTYDEARNGCVPLLKAIAQTLPMVYDDDDNDVWFELIDDRWGAVSWEIRAKDCETLTAVTPLPF